MTAVELATKTCTKCGETKPLTEFHRNRKAPDGLSWNCKECNRAQARQSAARRRAEMGDEVWLAHQRERRRKHLATSDQSKERNRRQGQAYNAAVIELRERHRDEFEQIYARERYERGLDR